VTFARLASLQAALPLRPDPRRAPASTSDARVALEAWAVSAPSSRFHRPRPWRVEVFHDALHWVHVAALYAHTPPTRWLSGPRDARPLRASTEASRHKQAARRAPLVAAARHPRSAKVRSALCGLEPWPGLDLPPALAHQARLATLPPSRKWNPNRPSPAQTPRASHVPPGPDRPAAHLHKPCTALQGPWPTQRAALINQPPTP